MTPLSRAWLAVCVLALGSACEDGSLVTELKRDCSTTTSDLELSDTTDLGFSAQEVLAVLPEPLVLQVDYVDDMPKGLDDDEITLSRSSDPMASRVSRVGSECGNNPAEAGQENEVVVVSWSADLTSSSEDVTGTAVVTVEAGELSASHLWFALGKNWGPATLVTSLWDQFFEQHPSYAGSDCDSSTGWYGSVSAGEWSIGVDCDTTGDGVPEFSGKWVDGSLAVVDLATD